MKPGRRAPQKLKDIGVPLLVSGEKGKLSWDSTETQGGERRKTVPQRNWAIGSSAGTRQKLPERRVLQVKPLSEAGQGPEPTLEAQDHPPGHSAVNPLTCKGLCQEIKGFVKKISIHSSNICS